MKKGLAAFVLVLFFKYFFKLLCGGSSLLGGKEKTTIAKGVGSNLESFEQKKIDERDPEELSW